MVAGTYNITHKKGRFYSAQIEAKQYISGSTTITTPMNLTNYTATGSIRRSPESSDVVANFSFSGSMNASGTFWVQLDQSASSNLPAQEYFYDIVLTDGQNRKQDFLEGKFILKPNVTR